MSKRDERISNAVSIGELQRRWALVRGRMRAAEIEALVVQGCNGYSGGGGHFRWITGMLAANTYPQTVIFPIEGLMTHLHNGDRGAEHELGGSSTTYPGVGRRMTTPSFPGVCYTGGYDAEIVAREIKSRGFRTVGLVGPIGMYHGFAARLKELLEGITLVDATEAVDLIKAVKSAEDIALIRRAAAMQDDIMSKVREHIRPGMKDFEVAAYAQYVGQLAGSETGYILCSSAPAGQAATGKHKPYQGREIRQGDTFFFQAENTGPGGFFVHLGRMFVLGKATQELVDAFGAAVEAQHYTVKLLKPGAACSDIFTEYNAYMRARGFPEERRLHCHSQGYEVVERPLIRDDETMKIAGNMNIGIHAHPVTSRTRMTVTCTDNVLTGADGSAERLHRTPQQIFEL